MAIAAVAVALGIGAAAASADAATINIDLDATNSTNEQSVFLGAGIWTVQPTTGGRSAAHGIPGARIGFTPSAMRRASCRMAPATTAG